MAQEQTIQQATPSKYDEQILVVKRADLFNKQGAWSGLKSVDFDSYISVVKEKQEFLPRGQMEQDPSYKQIIPYLIFMHEDKLFVMQRADKATEKRLQNKYSLGIGGHIRQEDIKNDSIFAWAEREFHEEVDYQDEFTIEPIGILNDDSNAVGQVHIGFVLLIKGNTPNIKVRSELKSGELYTIDEAKTYFNKMESWSQIVFEHLSKQPQP